MRFITADYIFPISSSPLKDGVVAINRNGAIEELFTSEQFKQRHQSADLKLESYKGIICPGFINAHCHLELSHLKGKLSEGKGLPHFIGEIINARKADKERSTERSRRSLIQSAIEAAETELIANGIVAVADICNTTDTIFQKKKNRLKYHNFMEVFDLHPENANREFEKAKALIKDFEILNQSCSITPHASYTVSQKLLEKINSYSNGVLTIHNQETASENEMFMKRSGALFEKLSSLGKSYDDWKARGKNSFQTVFSLLLNGNKILFVHNTYTTDQDIHWFKPQTSPDSYRGQANRKPQTYFCFCPNANLFIENKLPDFKIFLESKCNMTIGTDSYASNWSLSILDEMKTITKHEPSISLDELLQWATINGAEFYGWQKELGSLEKGKRPGLNVITGVDYKNMSLRESSEIHPIT